MRSFSKCFALALLFAFHQAASATPILAGVYQLTGTTADGYSLTGDVTFNSSGLITAANLTYGDQAASDPTFSTVTSAGTNPYATSMEYADISGASGQVLLQYSPNQSSSGSVALCSTSAGCGTYSASYLQVGNDSYAAISPGALDAIEVSGSGGTSAAVTPEPSTLCLLGTGILGYIFLRLRRARRQMAGVNRTLA